MTTFEQLVKSFSSRRVSPAEVRAETWALGCRHQGRVLEGAKSELTASNLSVHRTMLLKAIVRSFRG